jgi:arylsulfatase A-like enzyme
MAHRSFWLAASIVSVFLAMCEAISAKASDGAPLHSSSSLSADATQTTCPNIVLIITDDQGYGPIGRHGHPWIKTPNLDALYDTSTRFTRFLVSPTCSPTRSALMTGRHSMRNGVTHTILERERLTLNAVTLPQVLSKVGYKSGIFGKWHLGDEEPYQPHQRGFHETFIHGAGGIGQSYDCSCADVPGNSYFDPVIRHNGTFAKTHGYCTDVFFSAAESWIESQQKTSEPFFAYIAPNAPHGPYLCPKPAKQRFLDCGFGDEQASYYGMIENIDANVGRLMSKLNSLGLMKNTVIIFMSDNGMTGGGSGKPGAVMGKTADGTEMKPFNAGMRGLKGTTDEGGVRVPFFVRWDGVLPANRDIDLIGSDLDVFPTLVDLAGGELPRDQVEGRSLLPLLKDPSTRWPERYLFTHVGRWNTGREPNDFQWKQFSVRNQRFRFVNNNELFDMITDPGQTKNVLNDHPQVVEAMRSAYDEWWKKTRPMMVNETAPMSQTRPFHELYNAQLKTSGIPDWMP